MDKLATIETVGKGVRLTFVDKEGFIAQALLDEEGLKHLRAVIDEHLRQVDGKQVLKLGSRTRAIDISRKEEDRD